MLVEGIDVDYYEKTDFGDEFARGRKEGAVHTLKGCTVENVMDKIREQFGETKEVQQKASDVQAKYIAK